MIVMSRPLRNVEPLCHVYIYSIDEQGEYHDYGHKFNQTGKQGAEGRLSKCRFCARLWIGSDRRAGLLHWTCRHILDGRAGVFQGNILARNVGL